MIPQSQIANCKSQIELVVFDLGRVLIRICDDWRHACQIAGVEISNDSSKMDESAVSAAREAALEMDSGRIDLHEYARRVAPLRGLQPEQFIAAYDVVLLQPYPGAVELLDDLHAAGIQTACLSNTSAGHWRQMFDPSDCSFFPLDRMTHRFASHLIGACKPSDAIYEHVERTTGLSGDKIVFFDDLEENVAAASRRGWRAQQIRLDADPIAQARRSLQHHGVLPEA